MLYALEQGKTEQAIIEQCIRHNRPLPAAIANAPELELGLGLYYVGFMDLTSCRSIGYGEGPISWLAIDEYCDRRGVDPDQREDMHIHIREMDTKYLEYRAKMIEAKAKEK